MASQVPLDAQEPKPFYGLTGEEHAEKIAEIRKTLQASSLPDTGNVDVPAHLDFITSGVINNKAPSYFGFVTGGVTPAAFQAEALVSKIDANVAVHLPNDSVATDIEDTALRWLLELYRLDPSQWRHRIFTTGATGSNILGLACGRDYVIAEAARRLGRSGISVGEVGLPAALQAVQKTAIQVLAPRPHSSVAKAASIVGLGRNSVISIEDPARIVKLNWPLLEQELRRPDVLNIIVLSFGEVNTGYFSNETGQMDKLRRLSDEFGAWIHVDAAFGLPNRLQKGDPRSEGIETADSITGDGHKMLNVPYDCGFFFSKHPELAFSVFQNAGAAYLSSPMGSNGSADLVYSPLNIGLENSRRFRALPVYASLYQHGRQGYLRFLDEQIKLARSIAEYLDSHEGFELLPRCADGTFKMDEVWIIVLFRSKDAGLNDVLVDKINASGRVWISGTVWDSRKAARVAVSNWAADAERDGSEFVAVVDEVWKDWKGADSIPARC